MPFEKKKKKYKTPDSYYQKSLYLDESDPYQKEVLKLLNLCGHKQAKFLGLLAHDFITRTGLDVDSLDKDSFTDYMKLFEMTLKTGFNPMMQMVPYGNMIPANMMPSNALPGKAKAQKSIENIYEEKEIIDDNFISAEDMDDMNNALAAFGV